MIAQTKAQANPTKAFFVRMITRDISLEDCILDLIDNSIDGAWSCEGGKSMAIDEEVDLSQYQINIEASSNSFRITDNCGGMSLDDAAAHAFSFGRPDTDDHENFSIGVYGIGMKRAVFKIGNTITIESTYTDNENERQSFNVPIDVVAWVADSTPPWDFDIEEGQHLDQDGVSIAISNLNSGAKSSFGSPAFLQNLQRIISRDYSLHLDRGLQIVLNDKVISGWQIELRRSESFEPVRLKFQDTTEEGDEVFVEIIGGMAAAPPDDSEPDEEDETHKRYGWYVACNGRMVVAADKTTVSGWGTKDLDWPQWHRQYSGFIGVVMFTAANAAALPLTTTKRSVDESSEIFRRAKPKMRDVTRAWIDYTNSRKQAAEEAKKLESAAITVLMKNVPARASVALPQLTQQKREKVANIHYSLPLPRVKKLAQEFGSINMSFRDVGLKSFEYAYEDLVGEE